MKFVKLSVIAASAVLGFVACSEDSLPAGVDEYITAVAESSDAFFAGC